jgi:hypothetical protein
VPFEDGSYSQSDVTKKLMSAASLLGKHARLQPVVEVLCDALGMIEKISGEPVTDQDKSLRSVGMPQGEFRKAVIGEKIGLAIMCVGREEWERAGGAIWSGLVLIQRLAIEKGQDISFPVRVEKVH